MVAANDVDIRVDDQPVRTGLIADDTTDAAVTVTYASLAWTIIKRDNRFALRLRDYEHPAIAVFPPIEYYPIDPSMRVAAELHRFAEPKRLKVETSVTNTLGISWIRIWLEKLPL